MPVAPLSKSGKSASNAASAKTEKRASAELPKGPVARPEAGKMLATDIKVEVQPAGVVDYDGQALPLTSPSGSLLAVQEGEAPSWEVILAEPGAQPPTATRISVYDLSKQGTVRVQFPSPLPAGIVIGRSADDAGFLVEAPKADGSRWIGKVDWATGAIKWLVQGQNVNAHAILTPRGELVYCRHAIGASDGELVIRAADGNEYAKRSVDGVYAFPVCGSANEVLYVFRLSRSGTDLEVIRIDRQNGGARPADTRQQWRIVGRPDPMVAHQMQSTASNLPPRVMPADAADSDCVAMFDPRRNRMARFNPVTGGIDGLLAKTINAVPLTGEGMTPGYFCSGPDGLVFIAKPEQGWPVAWPDDGPSARVLASPYVVRPLTAGATKEGKSFPMYLLIGPVKGSDTRLEITKMAVVP
jgi:hypothetical protein